MNSLDIRQTIFKNTLWLTAGGVFARLIKAVMLLYIARVLGTEGYGVFAYALSVAAFFTIFSDFGLSMLLMRELGEKNAEQKKRIFSVALTLKVITIVLSVVIAIWGIPLFTNIAEIGALTVLIALILTFDGLQMFMIGILRAQGRMRTEAKLIVFNNLCLTTLVITALVLGAETRLLMTSYAIGSGIGAIIATFTVREYFKNAFAYFDARLIRPLIKNALPLAAAGVMGALMTNMDAIMIGWFRTAHELGLYGAVSRIVQMLYMIPSFLALSAFPIINQLIREGNNEKTRAINEQAAIALLAISLPLFIGGAVIAQPLIKWLFGSAFTEATLALTLLLITLPITFVGSVASYATLAYGKQSIFVPAMLMGLSANIGLNIALIPPHGIAGSAISTVIALSLVNGYVWHRLRQTHPISIRGRISKIIIASLVIGAIAFALRTFEFHVATIIAISAAAYLGALWILHEPLLREVKSALHGVTNRQSESQ